MRGATDFRLIALLMVLISIHAPHAGRDPTYHAYTMDYPEFQSTRPMRGATRGVQVGDHAGHDISIHAPHAGRDAPHSRLSWPRSSYFNPRAPCGARPKIELNETNEAISISIHAPHAGRDIFP